MTVLIYVNTSKQVGDIDHLKVFANADAAETWFEENDPEGVASMRSWNEPHRPTRDLRHAADRRAVNHLAGVWSRLGIGILELGIRGA
jgi:hypothetical protein